MFVLQQRLFVSFILHRPQTRGCGAFFVVAAVTQQPAARVSGELMQLFIESSHSLLVAPSHTDFTFTAVQHRCWAATAWGSSFAAVWRR